MPAEIGFSKLPVPPWGGNVETPLAGNPLYGVGEKFFGLRLRIQKDGQVTVINERNGYNKTYQTGR